MFGKHSACVSEVNTLEFHLLLVLDYRREQPIVSGYRREFYSRRLVCSYTPLHRYIQWSFIDYWFLTWTMSSLIQDGTLAAPVTAILPPLKDSTSSLPCCHAEKIRCLLERRLEATAPSKKKLTMSSNV